MLNSKINSKHSWGYYGLVTSISVALVVWLLSLSGALTFFDGLAYDCAMNVSCRQQHQASHVLLVKITSKSQTKIKKTWLQTLRKLHKLGARAIVFNFFPTRASKEFYSEVRQYGNVVLGNRLVHSSQNQALLAGHPSSLNKLPWGVVSYPPSTYGIYRHHQSFFTIDKEQYPSLETAIVQKLLPDADVPSRFFVNFRGQGGVLPSVNLKQLLNNELVTELVKGHVVLVGEQRPDELGLTTPVASGYNTMSLLEFQGHTLNSLLDDCKIKILNPEAKLILFLVFAGIVIFIYQWLAIAGIFSLTLLIIFLFSACTLIVWLLFFLWLPVVEVVLIQILLLLLALRKKVALSHASINAMLVGLSSKLKSRMPSRSFYVTEDHWAHITTMVNESLDLKRLIFLERVTGDHRVREVKAINCSLNDIHERRRDYLRTPYSTAIATKGPLRIEKNRYLKYPTEDEEQYIVPLIFFGEVQGFWTFSIETQKREANPLFDSLIRDYSRQISELLYYRQQFADELTPHGHWRRYLLLELLEKSYQDFNVVLGMLEQRLERLEKLFGGEYTPTIVYNIFGYVMYINTSAGKLLKQKGITPHDMTLLDLIVALSNNRPDQLKGIMRYIIFEHKLVTIPVYILPEHRFTLRLWPLKSQDHEKNWLEPAPFGINGIVCELVDTTSIDRLAEIKTLLTERIGIHLRNDLGAITLSSSLLASDPASTDNVETVAAMLEEKAQSAMKILDECERLIQTQTEIENIIRFPLDIQNLFEKAHFKCEDLLRERNIGIKLVRPQLLTYAFASPELEDVFYHILVLVIKDTVDEEQVFITVEQGTDTICYNFSNTGFGIPDERFQSFLFDDDDLATQDFKNIRNSFRMIESWGAKITGHSEVGQGTVIALEFEKFI